ncbi:DUF4127 family protein [Echinicola shivajiensis]|uniref:DUF4127 family protein n=1 Tax=Echinicola shivajiensis TaxID=1035916 RepID=UPI001BFC7096|nr:DUF4127 family protein [Echinicola shivajiensis]
MAIAQEEGKVLAKKVIFIPLDDRPPCLQFPVRMGEIALTELVSPPERLLGNLQEPGQSDELIQWLLAQDYSDVDAVIIAADMLAYGGLVASRVYQVDAEIALERVKVIESLHSIAPEVPLYVQSVVMRLAPTADGTNEDYREALARWAEISVRSDAAAKKEVKKLKDIIPKEALRDYKTARKRNLQVNQLMMDYVNKGMIDYLILSQDDAKPEGVHMEEKKGLRRFLEQHQLEEKVTIQAGTDEVVMLLLARAINDFEGLAPRIKPVFSSTAMSEEVMPFEDKPLKTTVAKHIEAVGGVLVHSEEEADLVFYVYSSRNLDGEALPFVKKISQAIKEGKRLIIADIDPIGDVQGGAEEFTNLLEEEGVLDKVYGYASWNTAGNTIGTAIPHGVVYFNGLQMAGTDQKLLGNVQKAQYWFTLNRLMNDYYYNNLIRKCLNSYYKQVGRSASIRTEDIVLEMERKGKEELEKEVNRLEKVFFVKDEYSIENVEFFLPWNRTFEALVDFDLVR